MFDLVLNKPLYLININPHMREELLKLDPEFFEHISPQKTTHYITAPL